MDLAYTVFDRDGELTEIGVFVGECKRRVRNYDVEFNNEGQGYYSESGTGPWAGSYNQTFPHSLSDGWFVYEYAAGSLDDVIRQYDLIEADVVWCEVCRDWYTFDKACEHLFWDDEAGWWSGEGYAD